jgi:hypothetical protein
MLAIHYGGPRTRTLSMHSVVHRTAASIIILAASSAPVRSEIDADFFEQRVRPVLVEHCYDCHSADAKKLKGGLRLDSASSILKGGDTGAAVVAGKPEESLLITAVRYEDKDLRMPPPKDDRSRKLSDAQINDLTAWIVAGAPLPKDSDLRRNAGGVDAKQHWAFQPVAKHEPPPVQNVAWVRNAIDQFILAKIEKAGLRPAPVADPRTLIRRMSLDLTGLPPTAEETDSFISASATAANEADRQNAIREVIDRLLASPHYGERWGRHWLDLARYSDTKGYVYGREERFFVHAHVYRDWVIKAVNDDLPYNRFLLLQIAADQLVPAKSPDLAAMGFLTGGRRFIGVTHDIIDDRIDVVTRGTMALTVQCARCHDHKYDPIPTEDYYALYGVFRNCNERLVRLDAESGDAAFEKEYAARAKKLADIMRQRREEAAARLRKRAGDYLAAQLELQKYPEEGFDQILTADDIIPASVRRWRDFLQQNKTAHDPIFAPWHALIALSPGQFAAKAEAALERLREDPELKLNRLVAELFASPPGDVREAAQRYGKLFSAIDADSAKAGDGAEDDAAEAIRAFMRDPKSPMTVPEVAIVDNELFFPTSACEELWKLQGELDRWINQSANPPAHALVLSDADTQPNPRVFRRGNPARRGDEVTRHFPTVIARAEPRAFTHGSGRLDLANAIVDPRNPLTARVIVNRIWMHHFGAALVRTPSDFGMRADPPSHPELLDWLARRFVEDGWSIKKMHALIMASATYQQASVVGADPQQKSAQRNIDPENRLLAHFNRQRLDFEEMRDALLAVSGELDGTPGGKPAEMLGPNNQRRSIYGLIDRQFLPTSFRVFDFANPDLHVAQRHTTTVPQQALFFLNNRFVADRAKAIMRSLDASGETSTEGRVRRMHRLVFQREPTASECASAVRFFQGVEADAPATLAKPVENAWRYGWGEYDSQAKRIKEFHPLPHFTGSAWQGGENWPDPKLGWARLTDEGGHAGNDLQHAVIRRWVAPQNVTVSITGMISHEHDAGDGVRAFIVSSRHGELAAATVHHGTAALNVASIEMKEGEALDFVVDFNAGLNSDMFQWAPVIALVSSSNKTPDNALAHRWDAQKEFGGPQTPAVKTLTPWEQYAQVLLLSNEFLFVD